MSFPRVPLGLVSLPALCGCSWPCLSSALSPVSSESPPQMLAFFLLKSPCSVPPSFFNTSPVSSLAVLSFSWTLAVASSLASCFPLHLFCSSLSPWSTFWSKGLFGSMLCLEVFSSYYHVLNDLSMALQTPFALILTTHSPSQRQFCSGDIKYLGSSPLGLDVC